MKIPVAVITTASHFLGEVDIERPEDFYDAAEKLWEARDFDAPTPCHQEDFDIGDWEIDDSSVEWYFKNNKET